MTVFSYHELKNRVYHMLNEYTGQPLLGKGMGEDILRNQEEYRRMISAGIRSCCSGNYGAKELVKELIRSYLINEVKLTEETIQKFLPTRTPECLSSRQMFELLIYKQDCEGDEGFLKLWRKSGWNAEQENITITDEMVQKLYQDVMGEITFSDAVMVLSQLLFADTVGLGVIDTMNQQKGCIEEIQAGMNGLVEKGYNYRENVIEKKKGIFYSRDGVHALVGGKTVWLQFLSFGTAEELQRVLKNLIKDSKAGELTRQHPMIVVDTADGRRVSVSRPPATDTWVGLIRKFDTVTKTTLDSLYMNEPDGIRLAELLRLIVRSGRNIAITGEMASGKTTLFRACLRETRKDRNLRIIEADSFELNVRNFLPERNCVTMRVSDEMSPEEVLAFARKTTGQIFAVGEISSAVVSVMMMDLAKIATQLFFSAHYVSTEQMIMDFINAKLCVGGYTEERLAEMDVIRSLGFDIHLQNRNGKRCIRYINEIVAEKSNSTKNRCYRINPIYRWDEEMQKGFFCGEFSEETVLRAKEVMTAGEFLGFMTFLHKAEV